MENPEALTLSQAMSLAVGHQQAGRLAEAEALYRAILRARPDHAGANHNLGLIALAVGRPQEAGELIGRAVAADPAQPVFRNSLGEALNACGQIEAACAAYGEAIRLAPQDPVAHNNLGLALLALGRTDEGEAALLKAVALQPRYEKAIQNLVRRGRPAAARQALEAYLAADPQDVLGARVLLAALGAGQAPDKASEAHLERLYAARAPTYPQDAGYRAPELVARAIADRLEAPGDLLDAGCGTGLVGQLVRPLARSLTGVDLSAPMLEAARRSGVYDELIHGDLVAHLQARPARYDAIACAATLIHFGDLRPALRATAGALRPGGLFAFTLFPNDADPDGCAPAGLQGAQGGVFRHGRRHVADGLAAAGLDLLAMTDEAHESYGDKPLMGLLVVCRRARAGP